jgi:hypothetical protein
MCLDSTRWTVLSTWHYSELVTWDARFLPPCAWRLTMTSVVGSSKTVKPPHSKFPGSYTQWNVFFRVRTCWKHCLWKYLTHYATGTKEGRKGGRPQLHLSLHQTCFAPVNNMDVYRTKQNASSVFLISDHAETSLWLVFNFGCIIEKHSCWRHQHQSLRIFPYLLPPSSDTTRRYPKVSGLSSWSERMVQLSATRCSCIAILWVSLVSFGAITLCVASQRVFIAVSVYFVKDSVRKLLDTPSYRVIV